MQEAFPLIGGKQRCPKGSSQQSINKKEKHIRGFKEKEKPLYADMILLDFLCR